MLVAVADLLWATNAGANLQYHAVGEQVLGQRGKHGLVNLCNELTCVGPLRSAPKVSETREETMILSDHALG